VLPEIAQAEIHIPDSRCQFIGQVDPADAWVICIERGSDPPLVKLS
jgi:hypothetical protein